MTDDNLDGNWIRNYFNSIFNRLSPLESKSTSFEERLSSLENVDISHNATLKSLLSRMNTAEQNIAENRKLINELKLLDDKWNSSTGGSYDPQIPYYIHRKNEKYDYLVRTFSVIDNNINDQLNYYGTDGWMAISMGLVDETQGTSEITMKKLESSAVKFNYACFRYEVKATKKFASILNENNKQGYDYTTDAVFTKSLSYCLMTKTIY
jgi:hypothetical protein